MFGSVLSCFIPGKGEMVKAAVLSAAVFADPDDAERLESWVDKTSASLGPTGEWNASDWAAAARRKLDTTIAAKRAAQAAAVAPAFDDPSPTPSPTAMTDSQKAALAESNAALDHAAMDWAPLDDRLNIVCTTDGTSFYTLADLAPDHPWCVDYFARHPEVARPTSPSPAESRSATPAPAPEPTQTPSPRSTFVEPSQVPQPTSLPTELPTLSALDVLPTELPTLPPPDSGS